MDFLLNHDITFQILNLLNKDDTLNFVSTTKSLHPIKSIIYNKYAFRYTHDLQNNNYQYIKHLITNTIIPFPNLISLKIYGTNKSLDNLPLTLQSLTIDSEHFNQQLDHLPANLQELTMFACYKFNQPLNNLPNTLQSLTLGTCGIFNQPLDNLPSTLKKLCISDYTFNQPLNKLPSSL